MTDKIQAYLQAGQMTVANLLLAHYAEIGMTDTEFVLFLQIDSYRQRGNVFPDLQVIAQSMGKSLDEVYLVLQAMIEKNLIMIEQVTNQDGKKQDRYNLDNVTDKLFGKIIQKQNIQKQATQVLTEKTLFMNLEKEFGRALSPIEFETVKTWIDDDNYSIELIMQALREAVLNQAYSLKYMDRILISWEKQNIKTIQDVKRMREMHEQRKANAKPQPSSQPNKAAAPRVPLYDWTD